jgi:hypothetical protein
MEVSDVAKMRGLEDENRRDVEMWRKKYENSDA